MYETLVASGAIANDLEFLRGALIEKMPKTPLHTYFRAALVEVLQRVLNSTYLIRKEEPLALADSEPEPDVAIILGNKNDFLTRTHTRQMLLLRFHYLLWQLIWRKPVFTQKRKSHTI